MGGEGEGINDIVVTGFRPDKAADLCRKAVPPHRMR